MFLNVVSLLVGFLCLFLVALMLCNQKPNQKSNGYFIIILFVAGLQRFANALEVLGFTSATFSPLKIRMTFAFFIVPLYYLFFKRLIRKKNSVKKELFHFIVPAIFVAFDFLVTNYTLSYYWYLAFSIGYFGSILVLIKDLFQLTKLNLFEKRNYKTIQTWALLMVSITFLLVVYSNYFLLSDKEPKINLNVFYSLSSFLWLFALIYMFRNPTIIFGEQYLIKNIQKETTVYFDDFGVPHIYAANAEDAYRSLGYVHAQDRLFQMEMMRRVCASASARIASTAATVVSAP